MKRTLTIIALASSLCLTSLVTNTGCKSPERTAYRVVGTTVTTVDTAMNVWGDQVRAGKATAEQQINVKRAYEQYQSGMRITRIAVNTYKADNSSGNKAALSKALDGLDAARAEILRLVNLYIK